MCSGFVNCLFRQRMIQMRRETAMQSSVRLMPSPQKLTKSHITLLSTSIICSVVGLQEQETPAEEARVL